MTTKPQVAAIEGWFTMDADEPRLLGTRCTTCGTVFFPAEQHFCRNPNCTGTELEEHELGRTGRVWSWTDNRYQPPEPYVSPDPFEPYGIAAVELPDDGLVVMGQLARSTDTDALSVGTEVELVLETLFEDDEAEHLVWKWKVAG
jgi:uncharacterized OB-fold protein